MRDLVVVLYNKNVLVAKSCRQEKRWPRGTCKPSLMELRNSCGAQVLAMPGSLGTSQSQNFITQSKANSAIVRRSQRHRSNNSSTPVRGLRLHGVAIVDVGIV